MPYKDAARQRESRERYRQENREHLRKRFNEWRRKRHAELALIVRDAKSVPCADCEVSYPHYVMDFDHSRGEKLFTIATKPPGISEARLRAEIEKCDVVCANCHRIRTFQRIADGFDRELGVSAGG